MIGHSLLALAKNFSEFAQLKIEIVFRECNARENMHLYNIYHIFELVWTEKPASTARNIQNHWTVVLILLFKKCLVMIFSSHWFLWEKFKIDSFLVKTCSIWQHIVLPKMLYLRNYNEKNSISKMKSDTLSRNEIIHGNEKYITPPPQKKQHFSFGLTVIKFKQSVTVTNK